MKKNLLKKHLLFFALTLIFIGGTIIPAEQSRITIAAAATSRLTNVAQETNLQKIANNTTSAASFPSERGACDDFYRSTNQVTHPQEPALWYIYRNEPLSTGK